MLKPPHEGAGGGSVPDARARLERKFLAVLGQLRHAYWNLTHEHWPSAMSVEQQRAFAEGLIAPQIRRLEEMQADLLGRAVSPSLAQQREQP